MQSINRYNLYKWLLDLTEQAGMKTRFDHHVQEALIVTKVVTEIWHQNLQALGASRKEI